MWLQPTTRGWVVGLAGLAWLVTAIVNRMVFPFLMGCAALGLVAASLVSALVSLGGIRVRRGPCGDAVCGALVSLPLIVENRRRRRRQPLVIVETVPFAAEPWLRTVVTPLRAAEERVVERQVLALQRGEFTLDRLLLRGGDPAGLFRRERALRLPAPLLVFPGTEPLPDLLLHPGESPNAVAGSPISAAGMSQDFYGVREYHPMDGLRYIHWKSSARYGRLMVREFERHAVRSVAVLLDAQDHAVSGPGAWSNLEYQVRAAASLVRHCAEFSCSVAFAAGGARPVLVQPTLAGPAAPEILYALATLRPGPASLVDAVYGLSGRLPANTVVFCLSLAAPQELATALGVLAEQGLQVRWYCARREVFAARPRAAPAAAPGASRAPSAWLAPAEVHPGMRLDQALSLEVA